ncbi:auxin efflux carrier [Limtongia smithiae]|uniref:auxin efflux carrier n=1 Tax=Limtongia smithiae TaxID=1125753 RepID=UPI0034CFB84D
MTTVGASIFVAVKPIVKIFLSVCAGIYFSKRGVLDVHTCKKMSSIIINYFFPCIIFSKVINAFDSHTMTTVGLCVLAAVFYIGIGFVLAVVMRLISPVPKYWRGGAANASIFNNSGDIPMAYVMTITASAPFSTDDETKGIAYVSIIMSVYVVSMFTLGGVQSIENDFKVNTDDLESIGDVKEQLDMKTKLPKTAKTSKLKKLLHLKNRKTESESSEDVAQAFRSASTVTEKIHDVSEQSTPTADLPGNMTPIATTSIAPANSRLPVGTDFGLNETTVGDPLRRTNTISSVNTAASALRPMESAGMRSIRQRQLRQTMSDAQTADLQEDDDGEALDPVVSAVTMNIEATQHYNWFLSRCILFLRNLYQPPAASLIISIIIAVIDPVKALFVSTEYNMRQAPDGLPPLDFFMDFVDFIGNASVPMGLLLLGAMIGRLSIHKMPRGFWKCLVILVMTKLVVLPIIAIAWSEALRRVGLIAEDNYILIFVFIVSSAVPSSTSQVYLTTFFAPEDQEIIPQMDCLAAALISQYISLIFTLAILVTYVLQKVI